MVHRRHLRWVLLAAWASWSLTAGAQEPRAPAPETAREVAPSGPTTGRAVELEPVADDRVEERLGEVLAATRELEEVRVTVRAGVVYLEGRAEDAAFAELATELARRTEGVVAVVNRIELVTPLWDLRPAQDELQLVARDAVAALPSIGLGVALVLTGLLLGQLATRAARPALARRLSSRLLREVAARTAGALVVLLAVYLALRVGGLTRLAVTLLGGTGLVGLVVGIAFRGITENFLASLLLSVQRPFREGDLVEVAGITGYVQGLSSRATLLTTLEGTQVQIPNATVFASVIRNWSSSASRREDFVVGIGYDDPVPRAQDVALEVLRSHEAVLDDPEPLVLVDRLGTATVDLRVYFWLDGRKHSWLKVRSSVIRLVKRALQDAGVSLPDESREVVFPSGVPVTVRVDDAPIRAATERPPAPPAEAWSTSSEGGLQSEAEDLHRQARDAWLPDASENLLAGQRR